MGRTKINAERRASYKEIARGIVSDDRAARRYGASQNTIGEIERALVAAFLDGFKQATASEVETDDLTWVQIPPRSRETLASMTSRFSAKFGHGENRADRIETFEQDGKKRWRTIATDGQHPDHSVADGSVRPLIRLGLLEQLPDTPGTYGLTELGLQLGREYWRRSDQGDPTLPKISLR